MKQIKFKICQKCNCVKRSSKNPLCQKCYNHKVYNIDETLTKDDVEWLVEEAKIFTHRLLVIQNSWFDMFDMNMILDLHERIYNRDYIGTNIKFGEQLEIMWEDIIRFISVYDL